MATTWYGSTPADLVVRPGTNDPAPFVGIAIFTDTALSVPMSGLVDSTGAAIIGNIVTSSSGGYLRFGDSAGGTATLYCASGDGGYLELRPNPRSAYVPSKPWYWRRRELPGPQMGRAGTVAPAVMATPPTISYNAASIITGNQLWPLVAPPTGSNYAGPATITGCEVFGYFATQGGNNATFAANAAAGATSVTLNKAVGTGQYAAQPSANYTTPLPVPAGAFSPLELVTVTACTTVAPFVATLSAPLVNPHLSGDGFVTTVPGVGYNSGSGVFGLGALRGTQIQITETLTDAPVVEFLMSFQGGGTYRLWVDGLLVTAGTNALPTGGAGQPANNAFGFLSITFPARSVGMRRIKLETIASAIAAVSTGPIDSVAAPDASATRVCWIGDSYLGAVDDIAATTNRLLGWDTVILNQIGGTGYVSPRLGTHG